MYLNLMKDSQLLQPFDITTLSRFLWLVISLGSSVLCIHISVCTYIVHEKIFRSERIRREVVLKIILREHGYEASLTLDQKVHLRTSS